MHNSAPIPSRYLCVSTTLLQPTFHGRQGSGESAVPEWPPSPLRAFQAIVAAAAARWGEQEQLVTAAPALRWLERLAPPTIFAPSATPTSPYVLSVPNNAMDKVAAAWSRGNDSNEGDANPATHRTMKNVQPMRMRGDREALTIHYRWPLPDVLDSEVQQHIRTLTAAVRCIVSLGWGIDAAIGDARVIDAAEAVSGALADERWTPQRVGGGSPGLRIPVPGTLDALITRHAAFLDRMKDGVCRPVPPLRAFGTADYRRAQDLPPRPFAAFALRPIHGGGTGGFASFRAERAICIAAMLRHAACEAAQHDLDPGGWRTDDWSLQFVAGHGPKGTPKRRAKNDAHPRFSYLPLPSIGHPHADGMIRRVIIAEPFGGDGRSASWVARRLGGAELIDEDSNKPVARLEPLEPDEVEFGSVFRLYAARSLAEAATIWTSITPVVLPGYDDNKPAKRERLLIECLRHAGIDPAAVASIESRIAAWPPRGGGAVTAPLSAFKRSSYLRHFPAIHVRLTFSRSMRGPVALGAGRHCGLGVFAIDSLS